jgi:hypothetical protein
MLYDLQKKAFSLLVKALRTVALVFRKERGEKVRTLAGG